MSKPYCKIHGFVNSKNTWKYCPYCGEMLDSKDMSMQERGIQRQQNRVNVAILNASKYFNVSRERFVARFQNEIIPKQKLDKNYFDDFEEEDDD